MIVYAIADLHGFLPPIPRGDVLLIAGDIVPLHLQHSVQKSYDWLDTTFRYWLRAQPVSHVVAVWGNHDWIGERAPHLVPALKLPWTLLQDTETTITLPLTNETLRIYGSPWQPPFMQWAFNMDEGQLRRRWAGIPDGLDILLLHGPPHGILDQAPGGTHCGSESLRERVDQVRPKVTVFGHIHHSRGILEVDGCRFVNVTHVNEHYRPIYPPVCVWLEVGVVTR